MKMITMKSVIKSDKECMPSAIMALPYAGYDFCGRQDEIGKKSHPSDPCGFFLPDYIRDVVFSVHNGVMLLYKCKAFRGYFVSFALCHRLIYNGST